MTRKAERPEVRLGELCLARLWRLAVAESCTGGLLGGRITGVPGSSRYFLGGVIAYADDLKTSLLGVAESILARRGAVSRETAEAMASGVLLLTGAEAAIAVTGVAGPGRSGRKPAGTVWVAVALPSRGRRKGRTVSRFFRFAGGRDQVREQAAAAAMGFFLVTAGEAGGRRGRG